MSYRSGSPLITILSGEFNPSSVPGLVVDVDASILSTMLDGSDAVVTDGTAVKTWNDISGKGHHFTQGTANNRPVYRATAAGKPSVEFDPSSFIQLLVTADHPDFNYSTMAMYAAVNWKTGTGTQTFFAKYQPTGNQREIQLQINTTPAFVAVSSPDGTATGLSSPTASDTIATGNKYVFGARWNGTNLVVKVNNNTGTVGSASPAGIFAGTGGVCVGALENGSQGFKGYIYRCLFYNQNPTDAQDVAIINYLRSRYSI